MQHLCTSLTFGTSVLKINLPGSAPWHGSAIHSFILQMIRLSLSYTAPLHGSVNPSPVSAGFQSFLVNAATIFFLHSGSPVMSIDSVWGSCFPDTAGIFGCCATSVTKTFIRLRRTRISLLVAPLFLSRFFLVSRHQSHCHPRQQ